MQVNNREIRKCCGEDPSLRVDTPRSSYSLRCTKCKKHSVGLTMLGAIEQWNNKEVLSETR